MIVRRGFLTTAAAATGALAAPRLSLAADSKTLRFVPQANLANLDPIWTTQYVVRNGSLLIWDMLFGVNEKLEPQPQMVEGHEAGADLQDLDLQAAAGAEIPRRRAGAGRRTRSPASTAGWCATRTMGGVIKKRLDALEAVDDRTFRFRLNQPYPKMLFALGKSSTPTLFIMPERIAATDPFKQISGICRLRPDAVQEGRMGARREGGFRALRRLCAARGEGRLAVRRQAHPFRPDRVADRPRWRHRRRPRCRTARWTGGKRRCRDLVPLLKQEPGRGGRYRRSAGQYRLVPDQPSVSAVQRRARPPGGADRAEPGRLHGRGRRRRSRRCGRRCRASSRRTRRFTPRTAARR